jgi:hypothetical protein
MENLARWREQAHRFTSELPYKEEPFARRNWGDKLHSLCSYQGKLKPAIAHHLVEYFTEPGDVVLDPLSGAGTIPLESSLAGRFALANDLQELGYLLSLAKCQSGNPETVFNFLDEFLDYTLNSRELPETSAADFGLNGKVHEYFHEKNLIEILRARMFIKAQIENGVSWPSAFVLSAFLHILHGNRPYSLSRRSHPVTPLKPTGDFEYKSLRPRMEQKIERMFGSNLFFDSKRQGSAKLGSYADLEFDAEVDCIITSPPFINSTRFYVANWMRLWACGWDKGDFKTKSDAFLENKQKVDFSIYRNFLDCSVRWLRPNGRIVLHLGLVRGFDMAQRISALIPDELSVVHNATESVVGAEKFGIRDQGATTAHQFLFLARKP